MTRTAIALAAAILVAGAAPTWARMHGGGGHAGGGHPGMHGPGGRGGPGWHGPAGGWRDHGWHGSHGHGGTHVFVSGFFGYPYIYGYDPFFYGSYPTYAYPYPPPDDESDWGEPPPDASPPDEPAEGEQHAEAEPPVPSPEEAMQASYGLVQLRGVPEGAAIDLDGKFWLRAVRLDDRWLALPHGAHTLTVRPTDRAPIERHVDVTPGKMLVLRF